MTVSDSTTERPLVRERKLFLVILISLIGAVTVGVVATKEPLLAIAGSLGVLFLLVLLKWPDSVTLLVIFYIYTNVGPVITEFHGVPSYIALGFPMILTIPLVWYLL